VAVGRIDGTVELWAWQEGARLAAFPAQCGCVSAVLFLHAGDRFLTAGEDGKVSFQRVCGFWDRVAKVGMCSGCAGGLY
jgi:telomerase protein component 1